MPEIGKTKRVLEDTWRFAVRTRPGFPDAEAQAVASDISDLGIPGVEGVEIVRIYYVTGDLTQEQIQRLGERLLTDPILEEWEVRPLSAWRAEPSHDGVVEVAYHPGVRDPVEDSLKKGALDLEIRGIQSVHTAKAYRIRGTFGKEALDRICEKRLVNATIQQIVTPQRLEKILSPLQASPMAIETVHLLGASDTVLQRVSLDHQLSLNLEEMRAIQSHYRNLDREPTLIELETIAQTWSEHCKHKTFRGDIVYTEESGGKTEKRVIRDLLKETIMRATQELNRPWCVSTFSDNAGVIEFDEEFHVCFKVETHNHPSALEPFGGASTGMGGVIRDILGTGCAAKPVASTDIFCFAPPDLPQEEVPPGLLHPRRLIKGVVAGVKDYGNKMGIPTVNGAVLFDRRFVGNPLVYCGNVGLLPRRKTEKLVSEGMAIVLAGGRTGRDGIHGATFSSLGLDTESEVIYSTAVQIGDPITEKKLTDAILAARDQDLFESITDCGAGGLSSAVGEMGAEIGARVELSSVPLKYAGLTPAEIWISESQERMVLAVLPEKLEVLLSLLKRYGVEAADVGKFTSTGNLELFFKAEQVGELSMDFLHHGLPKILKAARWKMPQPAPLSLPEAADLTGVLLQLLGQWDTCSKEWIVRQYDHEVQGGSVLKPLVEGGGGRKPEGSGLASSSQSRKPEGSGLASSSQSRSIGPSDAAVVRPRLDSKRGIALSNGINFRYGDLDPYQMALLNLDEAVRQIICVGGSLERIALLDNFCFGNPTRVEVLGALVRAAIGCYDGSKAYGTPFISGKDSLHNEYRIPAHKAGGPAREAGKAEETIQIPGTLLISAIGIIEDVEKTISMDAKKEGDRLYLVGITREELGGSAYAFVSQEKGGSVPKVDLKRAPALMRAVSSALRDGNVVAAHDCSEGGLGVAAAEMAFAGGLGLLLDLAKVPLSPPSPQEGEGSQWRDDFILFSESPSRFLLEVPPEKTEQFEAKLSDFPFAQIGTFEASSTFRVLGLEGQPVVEGSLEQFRQAWERPFQGW